MENTIKTLILITTYNRQSYLDELLPTLKGQGEVHVYDDGSVPRARVPVWAKSQRLPHHGRLQYHALISRIFQKEAVMNFDRVMMIPDDVMPAVNDPVAEAESIWQEAKAADPSLICLNMLVDKRGIIGQWGGHHPVRVTPRAWMTGWNDLCLYAEAGTFFHAASRRYMSPAAHLHGSGVGAQLTRALRPYGNLYQVADTLWHHRQGPSVMCPEERKRRPL